ncbi:MULTISPECIES: helix-turn-helix domain-containing protein [unclassified Halomonas]|uniref:helix-turn-helix domain-containing protein n=1 Tax=unclassified Halomonas TaxID=2609666 RepID=UPI0007D98ED7|nr:MULTISPECIES: helix-turn-helix domain-containing protein [unclassified Halomonas]MBT2785736.1 transcriptional regulator [Halomonas sp. ISL-106]MBT2798790.1 transcriptional regulator [Halomonas sp. ISL-104]OAL59155.1 transcriptional regulator [Halomonas sp. ALS9]
MNIQPIRNDADLDRAFARLEELWAAEDGTAEADELEVLSILIEKYENEHYPIGPSDPIEAIKFRMEQQGLTQRDLETYIGSSGRVSEVLNRRRGLSLAMIKRLHNGLKIPYESLMADTAA